MPSFKDFLKLASPAAMFGSAYKNPAKDAMPYLQQIPGMAQGQMNPYIQQGQQAGQQLMPQFQNMAQNPNQNIDQIMAGYKPSEGFQFQQGLINKAMSNDARAGGFSGTDYDSLQKGMATQGLASQDMYNYLDRALGTQSQGLQGLQGFQQQGFEGSKSLTDLLADTLGSQASLAYQGRAGKNKMMSDLASALMKAVGAGATGGAF